jgi:hypothetical protein
MTAVMISLNYSNTLTDNKERMTLQHSKPHGTISSVMQCALPCGRTILSIPVKGLGEYSRINMKYKTVKHTIFKVK